jgi:hypothetical protein
MLVLKGLSHKHTLISARLTEEYGEIKMIPKRLHYCWLSGQKMPRILIECMKTWKKLGSDYELILWDKNKFDITSVEFVAEACSVKKWAFASDYIRLYALYTEGGIYLDTDVIIKKGFSEFLSYDFFSCIEYHSSVVENSNSNSLLYEDGNVKNPVMRVPGIGIQAAVLGAIKGHPFLKDCLTWYETNHFILANGIQGGGYNTDYIAPDIYAAIARKYGFRYIDALQKLEKNMMLFPSFIFSGSRDEATEDTYAVHCAENSWVDRTILQKVKKEITSNTMVRTLFHKKPL